MFNANILTLLTTTKIFNTVCKSRQLEVLVLPDSGIAGQTHWVWQTNHQRLNGSSSPALTATSHGKPKIRPPTESKPLIWLR